MNMSKADIYIENTSILTTHGLGVKENFRAMRDAQVGFSPLKTSLWPEKVQKAMENAGIEAGGASLNMTGTAMEQTRLGLKEVINDVSESLKSSKLGVVLASTKYHHEDFIWEGSDPNIEIEILRGWLSKELGGIDVHFISNACTSGVVGLKLGKTLLNKNLYEKVLVLSYDLIGPFIYSGFLSLGAISPENSKPFSSMRKGLHLGEAFAGVVLSKEGSVCLKEVEFLNDGASAIRPTYAVEVLPKLYDKMGLNEVDLILAHGTGTKYNDSAEIAAISNKFKKEESFVTASKWSIGHTLGASALIDVCLSTEVLATQSSFGVNLLKEKIDPVCGDMVIGKNTDLECRSVLTQSLGFGGITGCAYLELV